MSTRLTSVFESSKGQAEIAVPRENGNLIDVSIRLAPNGGSVFVQTKDRMTALTLVGMVLGDDAKVVESNDPGITV